MASSLVKMGKDLPEVFGKGVEEDRLNREKILVGAIPFASALSEADRNPIGRLVTDSLEAGEVHESLQEHDGMMVDLLPVLGEDFDHSPQDVGGQMEHSHPGQDKETSILNNEMDVSIPVKRFPSDEMIPADHLPGCRPPTEASQGAILMEDDILKVFPNRLTVAKVMIGLNETFVEGLPLGASHHLDLDGTKLVERSGNGRLAGKRNLDRGGTPWAIPMPILAGRKLHPPRPFQAQEEFATGHGFGQAISLFPVPEATEFLGDEFPAVGSMFFNKGADGGNIIVRDPSAPDNQQGIHRRLYSIVFWKTPAFFKILLTNTLFG